jgi:hypothetical protein
MDRFTLLFPDDLIKRLNDIRARNLAAHTRARNRSQGIEIGGR